MKFANSICLFPFRYLLSHLISHRYVSNSTTTTTATQLKSQKVQRKANGGKKYAPSVWPSFAINLILRSPSPSGVGKLSANLQRSYVTRSPAVIENLTHRKFFFSSVSRQLLPDPSIPFTVPLWNRFELGFLVQAGRLGLGLG